MYQENPERVGDWVTQSYQTFMKWGFTIYPEQRMIYDNLYKRLTNQNIVEFGCGIGTGTYLLSMKNDVLGTDVSQQQIQYCKQLYPLLNFKLWNIAQSPFHTLSGGVVVAIDVIEHIKDYKLAMEHILASGDTVYLSTPNRNNPKIGDNKPHNDLHVKEFTPTEMLEMIGDRPVRLLTYDKFKEVNKDTTVTPLVYEIKT